MAVLVLADHQDGALSQPTRSTVAAAAKLGDVHVLIAGGATGPAAAAAAKLPSVAKVLTAEAEIYANGPSPWPRCWWHLRLAIRICWPRLPPAARM